MKKIRDHEAFTPQALATQARGVGFELLLHAGSDLRTFVAFHEVEDMQMSAAVVRVGEQNPTYLGVGIGQEP